MTVEEMIDKVRDQYIGQIYALKAEAEKNWKELEVYKKAYGLMAKDYCENMGCSFCNHHAKCLEANHFEGLEGKDFLQKMFINKVNNDT